MSISNFITQPNITVAVTPADLQDFAQAIIERTFSEISKMKEQTSERYLTPDETAAMLCVSKNTLWRWNKEGYLCPVKVGRKSLYPHSVVEQLLRNN